MRVLITGAGGRIGRAVTQEFRCAGHHVVPLTRTALDVTSPADVASATFANRPDVIINCSAYGGIEEAEIAQEDAFAVNATGPAILADIAKRTGTALVHYSTDLVFDGLGAAPYSETDRTRPSTIFGASKLAGERHAIGAPAHFVLRLASVFGGAFDADCRPTSVDWLIEAITTGPGTPVFVDRFISLSYAPDVAAATRTLLEARAPAGIYHCVNTGHCTWRQLANEIATQLGIAAQLRGWGRFADSPLPQYCALSSAKLAAQGIVTPHWQNAIARHLRARHSTEGRVVPISGAPVRVRA